MLALLWKTSEVGAPQNLIDSFWHCSRWLGSQRKDPKLMTKSLETITEAIHNPKHPFPQVADRPDKQHKNRYERRKVKQYIQLGRDWTPEAR
jgi:hypothetical protein